MGFGIFRGAYLVTHIKSLGGTQEYDVVMVIGGFGTNSEPWRVKSMLTCKIYTVTAMDIARQSYHLNGSQDDANAIYTSCTDKKLDTPPPSTQNQIDANPF